MQGENWLNDLGSPNIKLAAEQELTVLNFRLANWQMKFSMIKAKQQPTEKQP